MGVTATILDGILRDTAPSDETLDAVRERRDEVLGIAACYPGALRTYASGSIAHRTANDDTDADGGVVLDRRCYPDLGPDSDGEGPADIVADMRAYLRDALKGSVLDVEITILDKQSKGVPIDEQANDDVVHLDRFREADRLPDQTFDPCA